MVVGGGFEPPKASPTDLQSVPFDHSGTPPLLYKTLLITGVTRSGFITAAPLSIIFYLYKTIAGASGGTRTPDPLITNQ